MSRPVPDELFEFMAPYAPHILELMLAVRERVLEVAPQATEILYDATYTVVFAYSYTHSHVQGFIHISVFAKHVNLGFNYGIDLDDPEGRLRGDGSQVRHVQIKSLEDADDPYYLNLIRDAEKKGIRPEEPLEPIQIVKVMKGAKRRPN